MTIAVVASCTKTEISYDEPNQITFAPVAKVSTKAAVNTYPTDLPLLVYANAGIKNTTTPTDITSFTEVYLNYHKAYSIQEDSSVISSNLTKWCHHHHKPVLEHFHPPTGNLMPTFS